MALPVSGAISFNAINVELGVSGTTQASLNQASYRTLAGVPSGAISLSDFYGKANEFAFTISSNQTNANLRTLAVNAGWNQSTKVKATIGSGVEISSTSTGTPALTVNGSFPGGVELINSGIIVGRGGNGGRGGWDVGFNDPNGLNGGAGGTALAVSVALSLNNANIISGGGGGGGGGSLGDADAGQNGGGGGGGGGGFGAAGAGGRGDVNGQNGVAGGQLTGGAGGQAGNRAGVPRANGGGGGTNAASGVTATGGSFTNGTGGAGGNAITGNSNITYIATGTRYGGIS
jgi:hypothetical protein